MKNLSKSDVIELLKMYRLARPEKEAEAITAVIDYLQYKFDQHTDNLRFEARHGRNFFN